MSTRWKLYWLLVAVMAAIYLVMVAWSLPYLKMLGGDPAFDLRPGGYAFAEARDFIAALGSEGRGFYLNVQHRLDLVYPALLGAVLVIALVKLAPRRIGWLLAAVAVAGSVFDYLENHAVSVMLRAGTDGLTAEMVASASRWTVLKSAFSALAMTALLALLVLKGIAWLRTRKGR